MSRLTHLGQHIAFVRTNPFVAVMSFPKIVPTLVHE